MDKKPSAEFWNLFFGYCEIQTRVRSKGNRIVYEGRYIEHHADGTVVDHGWKPSGVEVALS